MRAEADGTTALHWAVRADDLELVRLLLRAGANARAANRYGVTPLQLAATNGSVHDAHRCCSTLAPIRTPRCRRARRSS